MFRNLFGICLLLVGLCMRPAPAQQNEQQPSVVHDHAHMAGMDGMAGMDHGGGAGDGNFFMEQASGTSVNPSSSPMEMVGIKAGSWSLSGHGVMFLTESHSSGPRGANKFFAPNWLMGTAEHRLGRGSIMFRSMLSFDPATVTKRRYPLLFQTGETAYGKPIVDGQHPHDLFMELAVQYARPLGEKTSMHLYFAPMGDPALGPAAFPHRVSAAELPQATLAHHLQDSTHIASEVITAGITHGMFRMEASGFHGAEPNENRWNIDYGAIDSWSTRLTLSPTNNWTGQVSVGRIKRPENHEPQDVVRSTASVTYNRPMGDGNWATSLVWGRNHKTAQKNNLNSYLLESVRQFRKKNYITGRIELVDKDELFNNDDEVREHLEETAGSAFRIGAYTIGYTRDVDLVPGLLTGFGANFTAYSMPSAIKPYYGNHPVSVLAFMRIRIKGKEHMQHDQMQGHHH